LDGRRKRTIAKLINSRKLLFNEFRETVDKFWEIEEATDRFPSEKEKQCEVYFLKNVFSRYRWALHCSFVVSHDG